MSSTMGSRYLAFDDLADILEVEGFRHEVVEGLAICGVAQETLHVRGHGDKARDLPVFGVGTRIESDFEAVHLGKMEVHQDDVIVILLQGLEGSLAVIDDIDDVASLRQQELEEILGDRIVFGNQNAAGFA